MTTTVEPAPTLCDLYLRLSDGRNENGSFVEREHALRQKASTLGWTVHRVVIENDVMPGGVKNASAFKRRKITLPDGTTAMRVVRPGFRSVLADLASGRVAAVLAEDLDRTMRDPRDAQDLIDVIREKGANARSLSGSLTLTDGGTDAEIMMTEVMVSVARKSSADTSRRVKDGKTREAQRGKFHGGRRPFGFEADGVTILDSEAEEIHKASEAVLAGQSLREYVKGLRDRGVPTVAGTRWTAQCLRQILLRPRNAGIQVHRGQEIGKAPWDPIVEEETFRAVVAKLKDPSRFTKRGPAPRWLGSGLYRCVCGSTMGILSAGNQRRATAYVCSRDGSGTGDVHVRRNAEKLDALVRDVLIERLSRPDLIEAVRKPVKDGVDLPALRAEARNLQDRMTGLADAFADGDIDRAQMISGTGRLRVKLDTITATLASLTDVSPLAPVLVRPDTGAAFGELTLAAQRAIVRELVSVIVMPTPQGPTFDPTSIEFRWHPQAEA